MRGYFRIVVGKAGAFVALTACLVWGGCARPPAETGAGSGAAQKLPFDGQVRKTGISPSRSLVPSGAKLPEGTQITIRLQSALSSAMARAGDFFSATVDEPVVVDGQIVVAAGTLATGRVLEVRASTPGGINLFDNAPEPGYLRIVLVSLQVGGKTVIIETSSIFAKGGTREARGAAAPGESVRESEEVVFGVDRRLNFRLAQSVDLQ